MGHTANENWPAHEKCPCVTCGHHAHADTVFYGTGWSVTTPHRHAPSFTQGRGHLVEPVAVVMPRHWAVIGAWALFKATTFPVMSGLAVVW